MTTTVVLRYAGGTKNIHHSKEAFSERGASATSGKSAGYTNIPVHAGVVLCVGAVMGLVYFLFFWDKAAIDETLARTDVLAVDSSAPDVTGKSRETGTRKTKSRTGGAEAARTKAAASGNTRYKVSARDAAEASAGERFEQRTTRNNLKLTASGSAKIEAGKSKSNELARAGTQSSKIRDVTRADAQSSELRNPRKQQDLAALDDHPDNFQNDPLETGPLSISGLVLDEAGEPVPGIKIIARWTRLFNVYEGIIDPQGQRERITQTGSDGFYQFQQLADGEYQIRTTATDRYAMAGIGVRAGVDSANLVLLEQLRKLRVYGVAESTEGAPLDGVHVLPFSQPAGATSSDQAGTYEFYLTLKGSSRSYLIWFRREGYKGQQLRLDRIDYEGIDEVRLDIVMEPLGALVTVAGRVSNSDGAPVPGEKVKLSSTQVKRAYTAVTNPAGGFLIAGVATATDYRLQIYPKGPYQNYFKQGLQVKAQGLNLEVVLEPLGVGTVAGQMLDPDGNPVPHFSLWLRSMDGGSRHLQVTGDDEGYYVVEQAPQGRLSFETLSFPRFGINGIYLPANAEKNVDLVLNWGSYQLPGRVLDSQGRPVPVSDIYLIWSLRENGVSSSSTRKTSANAEGYFLFTQLGQGPHKILINNAPGFEKFELEYDVSLDGEEVLVQLQELPQ